MTPEELAQVMHAAAVKHVRDTEGTIWPPWADVPERTKARYLAVAKDVIAHVLEKFPLARSFVG